jgi:hypothetical protein
VTAEGSVETHSGHWVEAHLLETELKLSGSKDESARRLALSYLIITTSAAKGWSDEQRERLERFREGESI